jgi:hypothetical protein
MRDVKHGYYRNGVEIHNVRKKAKLKTYWNTLCTSTWCIFGNLLSCVTPSIISQNTNIENIIEFISFIEQHFMEGEKWTLLFFSTSKNNSFLQLFNFINFKANTFLSVRIIPNLKVKIQKMLW